MLDKFLNFVKQLVPRSIFNFFQPAYHYSLALLAALIYRFPARSIKIVMITGTKGKSTTAELVNSILEAGGINTALSSTIRTKVGDQALPNLYKMTTPGRFFLQKFLRRAVGAGCEWAIVEMTSQAVAQYRHKFIDPTGLIFTGIHPEHIEAHGSFENYLASKLKLAQMRPEFIVANLDDKYGEQFLTYARDQKVGFGLAEFDYETKLPGDFNKMNVLAAAKMATALGVDETKVREAVKRFEGVPGRMEFVQHEPFEVVVDYAHTPESLEAVYKSFVNHSLVCVLGSAGGGRDKWKRPEFGKIANKYCHKIILTDEDPYEEDPRVIVDEIATRIADKTKLTIELDRRKAIAMAISLAVVPPFGGGTASPVVIITGKGSETSINGPHGSKLPWSDKKVALDELAKLN